MIRKTKLYALSFGNHNMFYEYGKFKYPHRKALNLIVGESRVFRISGKTAKTLTTRPGISEPVMVSPNEIVLLGKAPGKCKFGVENKDGKSLEVKLNVRYRKLLNSLFGNKGEDSIPPVEAPRISLSEANNIKTLKLKQDKPTLFKTQNKIVRFVLSDPHFTKPLVVAPNKVYFEGKSKGETTVFIWDDQGNLEGLLVKVSGSVRRPEPVQEEPLAKKTSGQTVNTVTEVKYDDPAFHEVEYWTGSRKDIVSLKDNEIKYGRESCIKYNNRGVKALVEENYRLAISYFKIALKADPTYQLAKDNLSIAYNNYGLAMQHNPPEAMKLFHQALILAPDNMTTRQNFEGIIRYMNRDPNNFDDRVDLGDVSLIHGDTLGAIVHYKAALKIKDDPKTRIKLEKLIRASEPEKHKSRKTK